MANKTVPVYLFTGFLDGGKTTFLQDVLLDTRFQGGERTLIVQCEEGEVELDTSRVKGKITVATVDELEQLTPAFLLKAYRQSRAERVCVEYNGMWPIGALIQNLPPDWQIIQVMMNADATTFEVYLNNMRPQMLDKLSLTEMVGFNRCPTNIDKQAFHDAVRAVNRRCDILFEYEDGTIDYDDLPNELPWDMDADTLCIEDDDFGILYLDAMDRPDAYDGKTIEVLVQAAVSKKLPPNTFIGGRFCMTCCEEDATYIGFPCEYPMLEAIPHRGFVRLTATIRSDRHFVYQDGNPGIILSVKSVEMVPTPENIYVYYR